MVTKGDCHDSKILPARDTAARRDDRARHRLCRPGRGHQPAWSLMGRSRRGRRSGGFHPLLAGTPPVQATQGLHRLPCGAPRRDFERPRSPQFLTRVLKMGLLNLTNPVLGWLDLQLGLTLPDAARLVMWEIGRAAWRERVC